MYPNVRRIRLASPPAQPAGTIPQSELRTKVGRSLAMMPPMPARPASPRRQPRSAPAELWSILRSAFKVRRDPVPFIRQVSGRVVRYLSRQDVVLPGARVLDAGAGGGALAE